MTTAQAQTVVEAQALEVQVNQLMAELYGRNRKLTPMYPWVFVRTLPKEQKIGSIYTPDSGQNKTVHEGIVLAVWKPFEQRKIVGGKEVAVPMASNLHPGDHVLFAHWAGLPVVGYSAKNYRIVKEEGWTADKEGGIFATVEYNDSRPAAKLEQLLERVLSDWFETEEIVEEIEKQFLLVDRDGHSVTLSGR
jgi:co-chaperonin GroES (HSP10)